MAISDDGLLIEVPAGAVPGRICAHTHLYSGLAPLGMPAPEPPPENFLQILQRVWWRLDRALDADSLRASARLYIAEALLHGVTGLVDHHESPNLIEGSLDILADAAEDLGMRAVLCYGATERNGGRDEAKRGLAECRRLVSERSSPLIRGMIGLHACFTASNDTVTEAGDLARRLGVPLHVHLAEDLADVQDSRERGFSDPLALLEACGALPPNTLLPHGVHLTRERVQHAAARGAWFAHNPRSNEGNKVGYAAALAATDRVVLGTDGFPADMLTEAAAVREPGQGQARLHRGRQLMQAIFGQRFDGTPGAAADLVLEGEGGRSVMIEGRWVVRDGVLLTADIDSIRAEARAQATRLFARMRDL